MELASVRNGRMKGRECFSEANYGGQRREFLRIEDGDKEGRGGNRDDATTATALTGLNRTNLAT